MARLPNGCIRMLCALLQFGSEVSAVNSPSWFDPTTPAREDCVLKSMLDVRAARHPDHRVALFEDGSSWTYAECRERVRRAAAGLQALGVRKGDRVIAWLPTGMPMVLTWFAANYLGAIFVPLNTAYRGKVLEHVINKAAAAVMIAHPELVSRLSDKVASIEDMVGLDASVLGDARCGWAVGSAH